MLNFFLKIFRKKKVLRNFLKTNKTKSLIFVSSLVLFCILIVLRFLEDDEPKLIVAENINPTYQSEHSEVMIYNQEGILSYRLITQRVEYFFNQRISRFTRPKLMIYDKNKKMAIWLIKSDRAELDDNYIFYLHGHIEANSLSDLFQLQKISADEAKINLITQDISSKGLVIFCGKKFSSFGSEMHGNLHKKDAKLKKVKAFYEI